MDADEIQYNEIKQKIESLKDKFEEIKIVFKSSDIEEESFSSYQFPINKYDENTYQTIKKYAELDYEISKRNMNRLGRTTKLKFIDPTNNIMVDLYDYHHSLDFLERMSDINKVL